MSDDEELAEVAFLWDGSEPGWGVLEATGDSTVPMPYNKLRQVIQLIEDDELGRLVCQRMRDAGCEVWQHIPKDSGEQKPPDR
jgi:hypothetical protein